MMTCICSFCDSGVWGSDGGVQGGHDGWAGSGVWGVQGWVGGLSANMACPAAGFACAYVLTADDASRVIFQLEFYLRMCYAIQPTSTCRHFIYLRCNVGTDKLRTRWRHLTHIDIVTDCGVLISICELLTCSGRGGAFMSSLTLLCQFA